MSNFKKSDFFNSKNSFTHTPRTGNHEKQESYNNHLNQRVAGNLYISNLTSSNLKTNQFYSAGVLPYQIGENGKIYFLVGKDQQGTWSDFGGKCEFQDHNNTKETAAREFFEESLNAVIDLNTIRDMLKNEKNYTLVSSKTISGTPYYMFVLRVPMLPDTCRDRFKKTQQYLEFMKADYKFMEKVDIKWVSLDTIVHCLDNPEYEEILGWPLRKVFRTTLINNRKILDEINNKQ